MENHSSQKKCFVYARTNLQIYKVSVRMSAQKGTTVGRQVRSGLQVWTQDDALLHSLNSNSFILWSMFWHVTRVKNEWRCHLGILHEQRCQGTCFCSLANDLFAVSFVKQINLDQAQIQMQWSRNFLFVIAWLRSLILLSHNQSS